jgi:8-oxo-dGTP pyrophosphatase MutT (NUDIX family)
MNIVRFCGASSLLFAESRLVLEVRKPHKWEHQSGQPPVIGLGCIGGSTEPGETPLQALHREAMEEVNCTVTVRSARVTMDICPGGTRILSDLDIDGIRPAMVWEVVDPTYDVGSKVTVFLASTFEDPQPGDLPAIILADPDFISSLEPEGMSVDEARDSGVEVRAKIELPPDGRLVPANTLRHLLTLRQTDPGLFDEFVDVHASGEP